MALGCVKMHYMEEEIARLSRATLVVSKNLAHNRMGCAFSTKNQMTLVYAVILARLVDCLISTPYIAATIVPPYLGPTQQ
jgi:hypothetical protein